MKKEFTVVFYAEIPQELSIEDVYPFERDEEIKACGSEKSKCEKYFVWSLFEYAVKNTLGVDFATLELRKTESGKWETDGFYFSLSHTDSLAAVALSSAPVGVDAEIIKERNWSVLAKRVFSDDEALAFDRLKEEERAEFFIEKWTKKESAFKKAGEGGFTPSAVCTIGTESKIISLANARYFISVASDFAASEFKNVTGFVI